MSNEPEVGSCWSCNAARGPEQSYNEFEIVALGELRDEGISDGWQPCVIYRPVLSGAELHEANETGAKTWFVRALSDFTRYFTAIN